MPISALDFPLSLHILRLNFPLPHPSFQIILGLCDVITAEMLLHMRSSSRSTLLRVINASWLEGAVPWEWRWATIYPIPKSGKDKRKVASYHSIVLTSHLSKLTERLILSRLNHAASERELIPPKQVVFREGRSVEDSLGRLVQQV